MQRFRKRSDAKRSQLPSFPEPQAVSRPEPASRSESSSIQQDLYELPPNDFRTSLLLPELSRRFTILRDSEFQDNLRYKLATQRIRGEENHVTEDEEEMIFETLFKPKQAERSQESIPESTSRSTSSISSSPTASRSSSKRYSNNLFGSNRFRDNSYIRSVRSSANNGRGQSVASESIKSQELRPQTPENRTSSPAFSTPEKGGPRSAPLASPSPYGVNSAPLSVAEYRLSKALSPSALKRASVALEEAIREMEEDAEDEIVMPRSAPITRPGFDLQQNGSTHHKETHDASYEAGFAISSDIKTRTELEERRVSPIPSRAVAGYIPGMPRPVTPRNDLDMDDQRSHSTTPRATTPNFKVGHSRQDSITSSRQSNSVSPLFIQRSMNGRFTPEDSQRNGDGFASEFEFPATSPGPRRRPASPLSGPPYQPLAMPGPSSPPSNITWASGSNIRPDYEHSRNGSWFSDASGDPSIAGGPRSLKSPALPDSPMLDRGHGHSVLPSFSSEASFEPRPLSPPSPQQYNNQTNGAKILRSPTPTQFASRSPISPIFSDINPSAENSRRSSRQTASHNPFTFDKMLPLVFSPFNNSSRSSLESAGSSYHSGDDEVKDQTMGLFQDSEVAQPTWHEVSLSGHSSSISGGSAEDDWDAEEYMKKTAGLKLADFTAIQEKLVDAALVIQSMPAERSMSIRRRRPSTSQSMRVASPPPQNQQPPASPTLANTPGHEPSASQSALLQAMINSIVQPAPMAHPNLAKTPPLKIPDTVPGRSARDPSPSTRKNRDLAQVLFGDDDLDEGSKTSPPAQSSPTLSPPGPRSPIVKNFASTLSFETSPVSLQTDSSTSYLPVETQSTISASPSKHSQHEEDQAALAREVERKTAAAMEALKKHPSATNLHEPHTGSTKKRISPNQISTPTLVSASTSVDTIPLRSAPQPQSSSAQQPTSAPSKIGSRFRKLRGTLRKGNTPTNEDVTPFHVDAQSPPAVQTIHYDPQSLQPPGSPIITSATEPGRFKVAVPSPPASAGPGLKGFMARFRGKQRSEEDRHSSPSPLITHASTSSHSLGVVAEIPQSPSPTVQTHQPVARVPPPAIADETPPPVTESPQTEFRPLSLHLSGGPSVEESAALKQLFDAASSLGLDQQQLNDMLLVRSGSTSSKPLDWNPPSSTSTATTMGPPQAIGEPDWEDEQQTPQRARRASVDAGVQRKPSASRKSVMKKPDFLRQAPEGHSASNPVVRRTIFLASDQPVDLNSLARKSSSRRRRASAASMSNKSIHDRVPTPPPPRSPVTGRFSSEDSPPVPVLPRTYGAQGNLLAPSAQADGSIEKSNSTYDSLYDMYSEEGHQPPTENTSNPLANGGGTGVEVVELANGELIWNIVNGLRDDDESIYTSRTSFASEYDAQDEGMRVFVKEYGHKRSGSRGSGSSFFAPKKQTRPETQVYMTPSTHIGRLIENLSTGMEAGSFNFAMTNNGSNGVNRSTTSSMSETDVNWSVEERLEHLLGVMSRNN